MHSDLPLGAYLQDVSALYNHHTLPRAMRQGMSLPPERWARIVVEEGELSLFLAGAGSPAPLSPATPGIVPPGTEFQLSAGREPVRFRLEYYHEAQLDDPGQLAAMLGS